MEIHDAMMKAGGDDRSDTRRNQGRTNRVGFDSGGTGQGDTGDRDHYGTLGAGHQQAVTGRLGATKGRNQTKAAQRATSVVDLGLLIVLVVIIVGGPKEGTADDPPVYFDVANPITVDDHDFALKGFASDDRPRRTDAPQPPVAGVVDPASANQAPVITPEPLSAPAPRPNIVLTNDVERLVCDQAWDCLTALNIMWCESGGRPEATNGNHYGLFQISGIHARRFPEFWTRWMEPGYNIMMAATIWSESGWRPWGCA